MKFQDLLRYVIWGGVALTADANRRHYSMNTTWLPHLVTNSLTLLLPDALRLLWPRRHQPCTLVEQVMIEMARDNDDYVTYVTPLALGYILSHPRFNIFKGEMGEIRIVGFGLDALPHGATGFALSALVCETLDTAARVEASGGGLKRLARWGSQHVALASLGVLGGLTAAWEYAEYRVHEYEMGQRGAAEDINMQWSMGDTLRDVAANFAGWGMALLWRRLRKKS